MPLEKFDERTPLAQGYQLQNGDGTNAQFVYSGDPSGSRFDSIMVTNDDVIAHNLEFQVTVNGVKFSIGSIAVPAGAGTGGVPAVEAIAALALGGIGAVILPPLSELYVRAEVAVTGAHTVSVTALGGDF